MSVGRNDPCPCGSGKKYKKCCLEKDNTVPLYGFSNDRTANIVDYRSSYDELLNDFNSKNICSEYPGFYDEPNFLKIEESNASFLDNYSAFIQKKKFSEDYLNKARVIIPVVAKLLYQELLKERELGACINASMVLSKILEREGIWCYLVNGSLTIDFPKSLGISTKHFWDIDGRPNNCNAAHGWLCAPPFNVVDITEKLQPYQEREEKYLPDYILAESITKCNVEPDDIAAPDVIMSLEWQGIRGHRILSVLNPRLKNYNEVFYPNLITYNNVKLKYVPIGTNASDGALEIMKNLNLSGRYPIVIYSDIIKPELDKLKCEGII